MKSRVLLLLSLLLILTLEIQAASPWTISFSAPVDNGISKVTIFRNSLIAASPGPAPTPTPWTDQAVFDQACRTGVLNMLASAKVERGVNFCQQWDNPSGTLPACSTTPPSIAACAFTTAQKNTMCSNSGRPSGCDLCP